MKKLIFLFLAPVALMAGCSGDEGPIRPSMDEHILIEKDGLYAMSVPAEMKIITEAEDIQNVLPDLKQKSMSPDFVAVREGEFLGLMTHSIVKELAGAGLANLSEDRLLGLMKTTMKLQFQDSSDFKLKEVSDLKTAKGIRGFLLTATSLKEKEDTVFFATVHNRTLYVIKHQYKREMAPDRRLNLSGIVDTLDFSPQGIAEARKKIAAHDAAVAEYEKKVEQMDRDGMFTGGLNGFTLPFKFVFNFFKDKKNKYVYLSEHHTAYTYWIGFVFGFIPGLIFFLSMLFGGSRR